MLISKRRRRQFAVAYQLKPVCANKGSDTIDPAMAPADGERARDWDHGGVGEEARILETREAGAQLVSCRKGVNAPSPSLQKTRRAKERERRWCTAAAT